MKLPSRGPLPSGGMKDFRGFFDTKDDEGNDLAYTNCEFRDIFWRSIKSAFN